MRGAVAGVQDSVVETLASARTSNRCGVRVTHQAPTHHPRMSHNDRPLPCLGQRQRRRLPNQGRGQRAAADRACPSRARQAQPASRPGLYHAALDVTFCRYRSSCGSSVRPKCIPVLVHRPPGAVERSARSRPSRAPAAVDGDRQRSEPVGRSCSTGTAPAPYATSVAGRRQERSTWGLASAVSDDAPNLHGACSRHQGPRKPSQKLEWAEDGQEDVLPHRRG
jgi:hypothetical protein